jgi:hypothetical protein
MTDIAIAFAVAFVVLVAAGVAIFVLTWRHIIREQVAAVSTRYPDSLTTSAQSAAVTHRSLRRIAREDGTAFRTTGTLYSLVATHGCLRLLGGRTAHVVAEFAADQVVDVRVGTTSVLLADYTTLFFGIRAGGTTYELPIRVNGPRPTSMLTARRSWATDRGDAVLEVVRSVA